MDRSLKRKVIAGAVAASAIAGAGGAIAATKLGSPQEDSQAIVNDAAQQLGVKPSALSDALKKALENRIDAEVAAGNLTKAEGDALKSRIAELFSDRSEDVRLLVPYAEGRALADLYALGAPIAERRDTPEGVRVRARLPRREIARFARFLVAGELDAEVSAR